MKKFIYLLIIPFLLLSCSLESQLQGKWQSENGMHTIEFLKDRTVIVTTFGFPLSATYQNLGNNRIVFRGGGYLGGIVGDQPAKVTIQKNKLTLSFDNGMTLNYVKLK
ncbi:MAG: hypothetical protein N2450_09670 [bacterium]|nr:hypothetical protein [bacterium]